MDELQNFKSIADEIMSDLKADEELRERTLKRCRERSVSHYARLLVPAAGFILAVGIFGLTQLFTHPGTADGDNNTSANLLMASDSADQAQQDTSISMAESLNTGYHVWTANSYEEARDSFGASFLMPGYIPKAYRLEQIQASGVEEKSVDMIVMNYTADTGSYLIIEDKNNLKNQYNGYESVIINQMEGYIQSTQSEGPEGSTVYTELNWFSDEVHYSISGQINKTEAIKIAEAMKE